MGKKVRILTLDGGGIRGIIPAIVLNYVEQKLIEISGNPNARIADFFDMIAGTSTGGILGCFYLAPNPDKGIDRPASKYTASKALEFYSERGHEIFNVSRRNGWIGMRQLLNATKFVPDNLEKIFREEFGNLKMSELLKPCIITTYNLKDQSSFFFSSRESKDKKRDFFVRDVVRSTSAAPTYFPPAFIKNLLTGEEMINIDGGVFANNPSMCAYAECRKSVFPQIAYPGAADMLILSMGTGSVRLELPDIRKSGKWGVISWAKSAPDIMMDGSIDTVDYQLKNLFHTLQETNQFNYKRVDVPLDKRNYSADMADASPENINALKIAGEETLKIALQDSETECGLDKFIELLIANKPEI